MIPTLETLQRAGTILQELDKLQTELTGLFNGKSASVAAPRRGRPPGSGKRRTMSPEARARIAAAAKARWAKFRAEKKKFGK